MRVVLWSSGSTWSFHGDPVPARLCLPAFYSPCVTTLPKPPIASPAGFGICAHTVIEVRFPYQSAEPIKQGKNGSPLPARPDID